jgi:hypothetical protein
MNVRMFAKFEAVMMLRKCEFKTQETPEEVDYAKYIVPDEMLLG